MMLQSFSMLNNLICVLFQSLELAHLGAILFFLIITVGAAYDHGQYDQLLIMTNLVRSGISPIKILRLI